jgi:hypothetical protein
MGAASWVPDVEVGCVINFGLDREIILWVLLAYFVLGAENCYSAGSTCGWSTTASAQQLAKTASKRALTSSSTLRHNR